MKLLIGVATKKEIFPLLRSFKATQTKTNLFSFAYRKTKVDVLITGVGIALTTYRLTKLLCSSRYDLAINVGIAGSFKISLKPGMVVNIVSDCFSDFGAENGKTFLTAEEMKLVPFSEFRIRASQFKNKMIAMLPAVKGITVNTVHGNERSIRKAIRKYHPDTESMEGAAFLLVCNKEKIPVIQLRAISNFVEKRNTKKWQIVPAIKNINEHIQRFIKSLP